MKLIKNHRLSVLFVLFVTSFLAVSIFIPSIHAKKEIAASTPKGQTLYTQFSLYYEENLHLTTNYRKGILVPVNTEVQFVKSNNSTIVVMLSNGQKLNIENIEEFSGENIDGIFKRTFGLNPLDLSSFTEDEKKAIMYGEVKKGMRKSAVIAAIGYPPKHKTPSLDMDKWQYWSNRFKTFEVYFDNDQVTHIYN